MKHQPTIRHPSCRGGEPIYKSTVIWLNSRHPPRRRGIQNGRVRKSNLHLNYTHSLIFEVYLTSTDAGQPTYHNWIPACAGMTGKTGKTIISGTSARRAR